MEHLPDLVAAVVFGLFLICREHPIILVIAVIIAIKLILAKLKEANADATTSEK